MSSGIIAGAIFILYIGVNLFDLGGDKIPDKSIVSCLDSVCCGVAGVACCKGYQCPPCNDV